ncbi:hypothetical protein RvY_15874 [Ramazzottius varieornatus]|uniref:Uncharacterized protein n=1 Tax=Ramazzottius varieornatus TaxID=947166 RepID=A0A1D1W497_RAMVA|nr:hypothetical protein RvY_15874 [Ramazzottius varieornatus]
MKEILGRRLVVNQPEIVTVCTRTAAIGFCACSDFQSFVALTPQFDFFMKSVRHIVSSTPHCSRHQLEEFSSFLCLLSSHVFIALYMRTPTSLVIALSPFL